MTALAFAVLLHAAAPPPSNADLLKMVEALVQRGDGKKAQPHLDKLLADPALSPAERARAEQAYGLALLQQKKPADAVVHLDKATTLSPTSEKAWLYLGLAKDQQGDAAGALDAYKRGVDAAPKSISLQHEYGMALLSAGNNEDGAAVLAKAAAMAEHDPELWADAAYALTLVGRFREAKEHAVRAVEMTPESPDAFYVLGVAEAGLGDRKAAKTAFLEAIENDETHVPALFQLGVLLQGQKDDAGAIAQFHRVLQVEPAHARAKAALAVSLTRLGTDDARAAELLQASIRVDPKAALPHALLAEVYARQGKIAEAKRELQAALKLKPDEPAWRRRLDELQKQR